MLIVVNIIRQLSMKKCIIVKMENGKMTFLDHNVISLHFR